MRPPTAIAGGERRRLIEAARLARRAAHAPYSGFRVGAAVLDERGRIHRGCNVENASYGLTVCAERNAVAAAIVAGARRITAVAVVADGTKSGTRSGTKSGPRSGLEIAMPCGACRQVLAEVGDDGMLVLLGSPRGVALERQLGGLLPEPFRL